MLHQRIVLFLFTSFNLWHRRRLLSFSSESEKKTITKSLCKFLRRPFNYCSEFRSLRRSAARVKYPEHGAPLWSVEVRLIHGPDLSAIRNSTVAMASAQNQAANVDLFDAYFRRADLDRDGRISGVEAVAFFQASGLPKPVLAQVLFVLYMYVGYAYMLCMCLITVFDEIDLVI